MISSSRFGRTAFILLILLTGLVTACARRSLGPVAAGTPNVPSVPSVPSAPNIPSAPNVPAPRREIAVLFSNAPGHAEVAAQLRKLLPLETYRLTLIDVEAENSRRVVDSLRGKADLFVVAIGLPAARIARDQLKAPMVFAQVFNYQELMVGGRTVRGVTAMPPLDLQVRDWKKLDPRLQRVGLIVSPQHADLIAQAELAAKPLNVTIKHEISGSDLETLYMFKRLAPQIDGLWLVPDDRILSPAVLRELLSYAASHGVRVCAFNDSLLQLGALMSASPTPDDTARTVRRVLDEMMAGGTNAGPAMTPLSELSVHVNLQAVGRLGLAPPPRESWIVRGVQR